MSDDLREELLQVRGIGESKADEIIEIYEEWGVSPLDQILVEVNSLLEDALDHFDGGEGNVTMQQGAERVQTAYDLLEMEADDDE